MNGVQRGEVSTLELPLDSDGNYSMARVIAEQRGGIITKPLVIPRGLRNGALTKGTKVIFVEFSDRTGAILMRADGEYADGQR